MNENLPVLILDEAILLPSMELRMDFDNTVNKKIFSISESYYNSNILIVHHKLDDKNIDIVNLPDVGVVGVIKLHIDMPNGKTKIVIQGLNPGSTYECTVIAYSNNDTKITYNLKLKTDGKSIMPEGGSGKLSDKLIGFTFQR